MPRKYVEVTERFYGPTGRYLEIGEVVSLPPRAADAKVETGEAKEATVETESKPKGGKSGRFDTESTTIPTDPRNRETKVSNPDEKKGDGEGADDALDLSKQGLLEILRKDDYHQATSALAALELEYGGKKPERMARLREYVKGME